MKYIVITEHKISVGKNLEQVNRDLEVKLDESEFQQIGDTKIIKLTEQDFSFVQDKKLMERIAVHKLAKEKNPLTLPLLATLFISLIGLLQGCVK